MSTSLCSESENSMMNKKEKNKKFDIDAIMATSSKTCTKERKPMPSCIVFIIPLLAFWIMEISLIRSEDLTANAVSIIGGIVSTSISIFAIIYSFRNEQRKAYIEARRSARVLSQILESVYHQIERINNGMVFTISYPQDWIHFYEKCCTYLEFDYLPYLLREFDIVEKINVCIQEEDKSGLKRLLDYRKRSITDWAYDFEILSVKFNLSMFASGNSEERPWKQRKEYKEFKAFIQDNYSNEIKRLTIEYLNAHNGQCDSYDAQFYVMDKLRKEKALQSGTHKFKALENKAMLYSIFSIYLSLKDDDAFSLCWGELTLKKAKDN